MPRILFCLLVDATWPLEASLVTVEGRDWNHNSFITTVRATHRLRLPASSLSGFCAVPCFTPCPSSSCCSPSRPPSLRLGTDRFTPSTCREGAVVCQTERQTGRTGNLLNGGNGGLDESEDEGMDEGTDEGGERMRFLPN